MNNLNNTKNDKVAAEGDREASGHGKKEELPLETSLDTAAEASSSPNTDLQHSDAPTHSQELGPTTQADQVPSTTEQSSLPLSENMEKENAQTDTRGESMEGDDWEYTFEDNLEGYLAGEEHRRSQQAGGEKEEKEGEEGNEEGR